MTATTPKLGIIYPVPTDRVTDYPVAAAAAATTIDNRLGRILAGTVLVSASNATVTNTAQVVFPAGTFPVGPYVSVQAIGTSFWIAYCPTTPVSNGFGIAASTKTGATGTIANLIIHWQAILPTTT